jgi:hypothetical protein
VVTETITANWFRVENTPEHSNSKQQRQISTMCTLTPKQLREVQASALSDDDLQELGEDDDVSENELMFDANDMDFKTAMKLRRAFFSRFVFSDGSFGFETLSFHVKPSTKTVTVLRTLTQFSFVLACFEVTNVTASLNPYFEHENVYLSETALFGVKIGQGEIYLPDIIDVETNLAYCNTANYSLVTNSTGELPRPDSDGISLVNNTLVFDGSVSW